METKMKCLIQNLFQMGNCIPLIEQIMHDEILNCQELTIQIFHIIDQIGNEENLLCLSKLVAEACVKEKCLSLVEEQIKAFRNEQNSSKYVFTKKILNHIGNELFHWISIDLSLILFV